nr:MAG TPA: hypothetical protein [Caudoviricetes sp.]
MRKLQRVPKLTYAFIHRITSILISYSYNLTVSIKICGKAKKHIDKA